MDDFRVGCRVSLGGVWWAVGDVDEPVVAGLWCVVFLHLCVVFQWVPNHSLPGLEDLKHCLVSRPRGNNQQTNVPKDERCRTEVKNKRKATNPTSWVNRCSTLYCKILASVVELMKACGVNCCAATLSY